MHGHLSLHIATIAFMSAAVVSISVVFIVRICRGEMAFVRQRLLSYIGMIFLLTGTGLNGGRYDLLSVIIRLAGFGLMILGSVRLGQKQAIEKKERERLERKANRSTI